MLFENYQTFFIIGFIILIFTLFQNFGKNQIIKGIITLSGSGVIIFTLVGEHTLIVLSLISLFTFLIGKALQLKKSLPLLVFFLNFILLLFIIRNYPFVQDILSNSVFHFLNEPIISVKKIGLSYILFRYVHFLVESYKGSITKSNFLTFLNYIFFFPTILAGPIDTYNNFQYWVNNERIKYKRTLFFAGITRIFIGAFKTIVLVPMVITYATNYESLIPYFPPGIALLVSLFAYSIYIFLDFSGYSDIAIGSSYLLGIKMPENFNNPYISQNLSEFWKRWHMTFSNFLTLYVFKPSLVLFNKIINPKYRMLVTILSYLVTFIICGLWHGNQINFVYWGLWHGVGLSINKL